MKKKILILPSWYPRPDDKINGSFFQEQAKLVSDQYDVKVLLIRFKGRPSIRAFLKTPIQSAIDWLRYFFVSKSRTLLPDDEAFTNPPLIEYQIRIIGLTLQKRYQKRVDAYLLALMELIASGWKPDLVHAHSVNLGGIVAKRINEVYEIPYVITEHMLFALCNYPDFMRKDIKLAFSNANKVLSLGYDMVRQLGISGITVEPNLIHNLVNESFFKRVAVAYEPGQPLKIITVGAASYFKDHQILFQALLDLQARGIPFTLTMIGLRVWGDLYDETLTFIEKNGLQSIVTVVDRIERSEVGNYLFRHNVFVMTSIFETFCVSIIEAMACGLPVITTNHGGGSIDIISEVTGAIVPVRTPHAIADRLEDIYFGSIRYYPEQIRNHVVSICGTHAFKQRLMGYYEQALKREAP